MLNRILNRRKVLGANMMLFMSLSLSSALASPHTPRTIEFNYRFNGTYSPSVIIDDRGDPAISKSAPSSSERLSGEWKGTWLMTPAPEAHGLKHRFKTAHLWQSGLSEEKLVEIRRILEVGIITDTNPLEIRDCEKATTALTFRVPKNTDRMARNLMIDILSSALTCLPQKKQRTLKYKIERTQGLVEIQARQGNSPHDWSSTSQFRNDSLPAPFALIKSLSDQGRSEWKLSRDLSRLELGTFRQDVKAMIHGKEFSSFQSTLHLRNRLTAPAMKPLEIRTDWGDWSRADTKLFEDEAYQRISETESRRMSWETLERAFRTQAESSHYLPLRSYFTVQPDTLMRLKDRILKADPESKEFGLIALAAARSPLTEPQGRWIDIARTLEKDTARLIAWMTPLVSNPSPGSELVAWMEKMATKDVSRSMDSEVAERARFLLSVFAFRYRQKDPIRASRILETALVKVSDDFEKLGLMGNAGLPSTLPAIQAALESASDLDIRIKAIDALRFIEGKLITEKLVHILADRREEEGTRLMAAASLEYRPLASVVPSSKLIAIWNTGVSENLQQKLIALIGKTAARQGSSQDIEALNWLQQVIKSTRTPEELKRRAKSALPAS